jgi:hypothetical protein
MSKGRGDRDSSAIISFYNDISNLSSKDSEMDKNE